MSQTVHTDLVQPAPNLDPSSIKNPPVIAVATFAPFVVASESEANAENMAPKMAADT